MRGLVLVVLAGGVSAWTTVGPSLGRRVCVLSAATEAGGYTRHPLDRAEVDVDAVEALVGERATLKRKGLFEAADSLRDRLLQEHGVRLRDRERVWTTDGYARQRTERAFIKESRAQKNSAQKNKRPLDDEFLSPRRSPRTTTRRTTRTTQKQQQQQQQQQQEEEEEEEEEEPRAAAPSGEPAERSVASAKKKAPRPYARSPRSARPREEAAVQALIAERSIAKREGRFGDADSMRAELRSVYGVVVDDGRYEWSVARSSYRRRGGGSLSAADISAIEAGLNRRSALKRRRQFEAADKIREDLTSKFGIVIDDSEREWRLATFEAYVKSETSAPFEGDADAVAALVAQRAAKRRDRDYAAADEIRDELFERFGVAVDDKNLEWAAATDQNFAEAARNSQRSAFARAHGALMET